VSVSDRRLRNLAAWGPSQWSCLWLQLLPFMWEPLMHGLATVAAALWHPPLRVAWTATAAWAAGLPSACATTGTRATDVKSESAHVPTLVNKDPGMTIQTSKMMVQIFSCVPWNIQRSCLCPPQRCQNHKRIRDGHWKNIPVYIGFKLNLSSFNKNLPLR